MRCSTNADCPACPAGPGATPPPCSRLCEARELKLYVEAPTLELTDLFLDPDEHGLHAGLEGAGTVARDLSAPGAAMPSTMSRLECCVDDWWPDGRRRGALQRQLPGGLRVQRMSRYSRASVRFHVMLPFGSGSTTLFSQAPLRQRY